MLLSVCVRELAQRETFCNTKPTCQHSTLHTQSISIELMRRYRKKKKKRLGKLFTYAGKKKTAVFRFWKWQKTVGKSKQIQSSKAVLYCNEILNDSGRRGSYLKKNDARETNERRFVGDAWRLKNVLAHVWKKKTLLLNWLRVQEVVCYEEIKTES